MPVTASVASRREGERPYFVDKLLHHPPRLDDHPSSPRTVLAPNPKDLHQRPRDAIRPAEDLARRSVPRRLLFPNLSERVPERGGYAGESGEEGGGEGEGGEGREESAGGEGDALCDGSLAESEQGRRARTW